MLGSSSLTSLCLIFMMLLLSSVALSQKTVCKPQPYIGYCFPTPECEGNVRKVYSPGCLGKGGRRLLDGGCQCQGYCGYHCASACQADPECTWDAAKKTCFNTASKLPGKAIAACRATRSPTRKPSKSPTRTPSLSPSKAPTPPTGSPTIAPSTSPTKSYCHRDTKFPGAPFSDANPVLDSAFGFSADGSSAVFRSSYFQNETGYHSEIWVTTKNKVTKEWKPQRVVQYIADIEEDDYDNRTYPGAIMSGDGKYLIVTLNRDSTVYKRQSDGAFKEQGHLPPFVGYANMMWLSETGDRVIVTNYTTDEGFIPTYSTINFIRVKNAWTVEWIQNDLPLSLVSADGNTAFTWSYYPYEKTNRMVFVRQGKRWVQQGGALIGSGLPDFQQGPAASFTPDGNTLVIGAYAQYQDPDLHPYQDSGAWVFVRSHGNWTQLGPKLGGGDGYDGLLTGVSSDANTILIANGKKPFGFKMYKKIGPNYFQVGGKVISSMYPILSRDGKQVVTSLPVSLWKC